MQKTQAKRWTRRRVFFLIVVYGVVFLAAEAAVRIINPMTGRPAYYGYPEGLIVPDETIGHRYQPGFQGHFQSPRYQDVAIAINRHGFRDEDWADQPTPGTPRVLVLGDSITFGSPLPVDERFDNQAEQLLRDADVPVEFCNCGVNGFAVAQYDTLLREVGPKFAPNLVLVALCLNDAEPVNPADDARIRAAKEAKRRSQTARLKETLKAYRLDFDKSYLVNLVVAGVREFLWRNPESAAKMAEQYAEKTRHKLIELYKGDGQDRLEKHLTAMRDFARDELHADFAVVVFPYQFMVWAHDGAWELDEWIPAATDEMLGANEIRYVDLLEAFREHKTDPKLYAYQDDCHPDVLGHRLAGEQLAGLVKKWLAARAAN